MKAPLIDLRGQKVDIGDPVYILYYGNHYTSFGRVRKVKRLDRHKYYIAIDTGYVGPKGKPQTYVNYIWGDIRHRVIKVVSLTDNERKQWDIIREVKELSSLPS